MSSERSQADTQVAPGPQRPAPVVPDAAAAVSRTPRVPAESFTEKLQHEYDALVAKAARPVKRKNLANVRTALEHMRAMRITDFSYASVARTIAALKLSGPSNQTVINKGGEDFKALIEAYAEAYGRKEPVASPNPHEDLVAQIENQRIASQVMGLVNENRSLRNRLDIAHAAFAKLQPLVTGDGLPVPKALAAGTGVTFTEMEVAAVREFLRNLHELDAVLDETTGRLALSNGTQVAGVGFDAALRRIASLRM